MPANAQDSAAVKLLKNSSIISQQSTVFRIADSDRPEDFLEYAAIISNCDLVITTGSTVSHLAASIGIPTWVLLPTIPEWRWGLESELCPWYRSVRLFRQSEQGSWDKVMRRVAMELQELYGNK